MNKCIAITMSGKRCFFRRLPNSEYCHQHHDIKKCDIYLTTGLKCQYSCVKGTERCHNHQTILKRLCHYHNYVNIQCYNLIDARESYCKEHAPEPLDID